MTHVGPGVLRRRGALPRAPDRVQVAPEFFDEPEPASLRKFALQQFTPAARRLAR